MAANPALIVKDDGSIEATPELRTLLHAAPGTRLELIERCGDEVRFRLPSYMREIRSWRDLQGILADSPVDPTKEHERERLQELELELGQG